VFNFLYIFDFSGNKQIRNIISFLFWPLIFLILIAYVLYIFVFRKRVSAVVYTYGKTGSTSLIHGLQNAGLKVIQIHYFSYPLIFREMYLNLTSRKFSIPLHLYISIIFKIGSDLKIFNPEFIFLINRSDEAMWVSDYLQNIDRYGKLIVHGSVLTERYQLVRNSILRKYKVWLRKDRPLFLSNFKDCFCLEFSNIDNWDVEIGTYLDRIIVINKMNDSNKKYYSNLKRQLLDYESVNDIT